MTDLEHGPGEAQRYEVEMTPEAEAVYKSLFPSSWFAKVDKMLLLLDTVPEIGRVYDSDHGTATLPFEARVTRAGRYGIYCTVDEDAKRVTVFAIEDQRGNPLNRSCSIYPHEAG